MCFGGGGDSKIAKQQRADEVARQNRIKSGMAQIAGLFDSGFNDSFYDKRKQDYIGYATPSLDRQASEARDQLIYALSRTGNLDSSAAIKRNSDLNAEIDEARVGITNEGINQANTLRNSVENTRGAIVAELNATGDAQSAAQSAQRQIQNLSQPAGFSPLGNLFVNFSNSVAGIGANAGNGYSGFARGSGLFSPSSGSQRVVGG